MVDGDDSTRPDDEDIPSDPGNQLFRLGETAQMGGDRLGVKVDVADLVGVDWVLLVEGVSFQG